MLSIQPAVAEMGSLIGACVDVQTSGYIDRFFVRGGLRIVETTQVIVFGVATFQEQAHI